MVSPFRLPSLKKFAFLTILSASTLAAVAEQRTIDWTFLSAGTMISKDPYGTRGAPVLIQSPDVITVLQPGGTPANPFSTGNALSIAPKEGHSFFGIRIRPFEGKIAESGFVELNFRLSSGALRLSFDTITKEWNPTDDWAYIGSPRLFTIRLSSGEAIQARSVTGLGTQEHPVLSEETNYNLRLSWEIKSDALVFSAQLNGLPLEDRENQLLSIVVPTSSIPSEASLGMVLQSGSEEEPIATVFIGSIQAKTGEK